MFQCIYYEIYGMYSMECVTKYKFSPPKVAMKDFCNVWLKKNKCCSTMRICIHRYSQRTRTLSKSTDI